VLAAALDAISSLTSQTTESLEKLAGQSADASKESIEANKANLDELLAAVGTLAEGKQTEGGSYLVNTIKILALAGMAVVAIWVWRKL
jgi:hypothetical protein